MNDLEEIVVARITEAIDAPRWQVFLELDDVLTPISDAADSKLAFQTAYLI